MTQESSHERGRAHRVVVIVDENSNPFELGCATEVFGLRRPEIGRELYDFHLCSPEPRTLMRDGFFTLTGVAELALADTADTLIVPNRPDVEVPRRPAVLDAVRRAHGRGARLVGFCSGAFTLAEAGVLDRRRATAHWQWADSFRARFPRVRFESDVLFVDDGDILTAAGSAAALDLGLHVVRRDHGAEVANSVKPAAGLRGAPGRRAAAVRRTTGTGAAGRVTGARAGMGTGATGLSAHGGHPRDPRLGERGHPAPPLPGTTGHDASGVAHR